MRKVPIMTIWVGRESTSFLREGEKNNNFYSSIQLMIVDWISYEKIRFV